MNSLFPSLASTSVNPDRLGAVRVLIVGNAGLCGRSCSCRELAGMYLFPYDGVCSRLWEDDSFAFPCDR